LVLIFFQQSIIILKELGVQVSGKVLPWHVLGPKFHLQLPASKKISQAWWYISIILALERLRQG
jgi:hypothetical protein